MTLTLELTPEQETKLRTQADAVELTPDAYLLQAAGLQQIQDTAEDAPDGNGPDEDLTDVIAPGQSLADALAGRTGRVSSGMGHLRLSENTGKIFTEMMAEKQRKGRL